MASLLEHPPVTAPRDERHTGIVLRSFAYVAIFAAAAHFAPHWALYGAAEVLLAFAVLRVFCLQHDLAHRNLTRSRFWDDAFGYLASVVCLLPYHPWRRVHMAHHKWAGWREPDPTEADIRFADLPRHEQWLAQWAWRLWLPLLSTAFSLRTFWNYPKLAKQFPGAKDRRKLAFSIVLAIGPHIALGVWLGAPYLVVFVPAAVLYLAMMDPLAVSQHAGIPIHSVSEVESATPFKLAEQNQFARTLHCPRWLERHVLLGFNLHSYHHVKPQVPGHVVCDLHDVTPVHEQNWWAWLREAKRKPLAEVVH